MATLNHSEPILPNLFIIGAMKSGTSSLHAALKAHPRIFMSEPKEPAFFIDPAVRPRDVYGTAATEEDCLRIYLDLFTSSQGFQYAGEASTHYTKCSRPGRTPEAIRAFNPDARIIYIIRDPVERTISHYWWNVEHEGETRGPLKAVADDPQYADYSYYAMQVRPYLDQFGPDRVWTLTLEDFSRDPDAELQKIYRWLDLNPHEARRVHDVRENSTPKMLTQNRSRWITRLRQSNSYKSVMPIIPKPLRTLARTLNERKVDRHRIDMSDLREFIRPRQLRETEELTTLLGRGFPEWKTLYSGAPNTGP